MAGNPTNGESANHASLDLLAVRLRRLEFLLSGSSDVDGMPDGVNKPAPSDESVLGRLQTLQSSLDKLRKDGGVAGEMIRDVEDLCECDACATDEILTKYADTQHPELRKQDSGVPLDDTSKQASIVLANATLYPETASRLSSLQTFQIPPVESSSKLVELSNEIQRCQQEQGGLDTEIHELRQRSARCLEWWVKTGVLGMGDLWEGWEDRMVELERQVARFERKVKDQEGYI